MNKYFRSNRRKKFFGGCCGSILNFFAMKILNILATAFVALFFSTIASAQVDLITAKECMARSKENADVVLIDANKPKNYLLSHIKGAINIDHNDLYQPGDIAGLIKSPEELAVFFGAKGISENSEIVVYDDGSQKYSTRIYWILKYLGANNVRILHKDLEQCRSARVTLTAEAAKLPPVKFTPTIHPEIFASLDEVKANLNKPDVVLVDCRTPDEYNGIKDSDGHIPGAININHVDFLTDNGAFKPVEQLQALAEKMNITPDKEVILYCKTSVRAAVGFVAFKNILGYEKVKVYDGAYSEWKAVGNAVAQ